MIFDKNQKKKKGKRIHLVTDVVASQLVSGILFSSSPVLVLRIAVITIPLMLGILFSVFQIFFSKLFISIALICLN